AGFDRNRFLLLATRIREPPRASGRGLGERADLEGRRIALDENDLNDHVARLHHRFEPRGAPRDPRIASIGAFHRREAAAPELFSSTDVNRPFLDRANWSDVLQILGEALEMVGQRNPLALVV